MNAGDRLQFEQEGLLPSLKSVLEIVILAIFIVTFIVQPFRIPSGSMEPTLRIGDFVLVDKQSFGPSGWLDRLLLPSQRIKRGDLVIFRYPVNPSLYMVKRVVGLPGDWIQMRAGRVLINGRQLAEPYAFYSPSRPNGFRDDFPSLLEADPDVNLRWWIWLRGAAVDGKIQAPPGEYFVLGDNRNDSEDSRYWGFVPLSQMEGRPLLVYFTLPLSAGADRVSMLERLRQILQTGVRSWRILR
ncbi:MAG: signal peptidase I [Acidobacteriota bacterium]